MSAELEGIEKEGNRSGSAWCTAEHWHLTTAPCAVNVPAWREHRDAPTLTAQRWPGPEHVGVLPFPSLLMQGWLCLPPCVLCRSRELMHVTRFVNYVDYYKQKSFLELLSSWLLLYLLVYLTNCATGSLRAGILFCLCFLESLASSLWASICWTPSTQA